MATQYVDPTTYNAASVAYAPSVVTVGQPGYRGQLRKDLEDVFYNEAEYAEPVTWNYADGSTQQITAIFDEEHLAMDFDTGAPAIASEPQIHVPTHKYTSTPGRGDKVVVRNRVFTVKTIEPDGTGVCVVTLLRE
jgi:hypothetical protein